MTKQMQMTKTNQQSKIDELTKSLNEFKDSLPSNNKDSTDQTSKSSQSLNIKQIDELKAAIKIQVEKIGPLTKENESLSIIVTELNTEIENLHNKMKHQINNFVKIIVF